jgi:hypothetical protein
MGTNESEREGEEGQSDLRCHELLWVECRRPGVASSSQAIDHWCSLWRRMYQLEKGISLAP